MITFETSGGFSIVRLSGSLTIGNSDGLISRFTDWLDHQHPTRTVFDLSQLEMLDSCGIGSLVSCLHHARKRGGEIRLAGACGRPQMALHVAQVDRLFPQAATVEEALAAPPFVD